jgi:hypothetical protein
MTARGGRLRVLLLERERSYHVLTHTTGLQPFGHEVRGRGPVPPEYLAEGLGLLLDRIARLVGHTEQDEAVILLADPEPLLRVKALPKKPEQRREAAAVRDARACGWTVSELDAWTTFHGRGRPGLHIGVLPWMGENSMPFPGSALDRAVALAQWHAVFGSPYHGTPGVAGTKAMRSLARGKPRWQLREQVEGWSVAELQYGGPRDWCAPLPKEPGWWAHTYDRRADYLASAQSVLLAADELERTGPIPFHPKRAGMWRVLVEPWRGQLPMPDPAGYGQVLEDGSRWLGTPTLALIEDLRDAGLHGGFQVLSAMTGHGTQLLRPWAELVRDVLEWPVIGPAAKSSYRQGIGMLAHVGSRLYRPDWSAQIIANARCVLWRKAWRMGEVHKTWPLHLEADQATYLSRVSDPYAAAPVGMDFATRIGGWQWKPGSSREVKLEC